VDEEETIELTTGIEKTKSNTNSTKDTEYKSKKSDKKVSRATKKLENWFSIQATRAVEDYNYGRELTSDQVNLVLFSADFIKKSTIYEEALNYGQKEDQIRWKDETDKISGKRGLQKAIDEKEISINR
jgi:hypothetical protein